jgi:hypothetical protein
MGRLWAGLRFYDYHTDTYLGAAWCKGTYSCEEVLEFPKISTDMIYIETANWVFFGEIKFE